MEHIADFVLPDENALPPGLKFRRQSSEPVVRLLESADFPKVWLDDWSSSENVFSLECVEQGRVVGAALFRVVRGNGSSRIALTPSAARSMRLAC